MSHEMFSEYSSARNFKGIVQKYYTTSLPSAFSQELRYIDQVIDTGAILYYGPGDSPHTHIWLKGVLHDSVVINASYPYVTWRCMPPPPTKYP